MKLLTEVLSVLRLQSNLQELVLIDDTVVLTNKPGIHKHTIINLQPELQFCLAENILKVHEDPVFEPY